MPHYTNSRTIRDILPRPGRIERFPKPLIDQIFYKKRADYIRNKIDKLVKKAKKTADEKIDIVDFGCGTGVGIKNEAVIHDSATLSNLYFIGIDQSISTQQGPGYAFFKDDLQKLESLKDETVDFGFSCAVLDYVDDKVLALKNIWRTLKLGGKAIVSITPDHFGPYALDMFPRTDDIFWDDDFQALTLRKTHTNSAALACSQFSYVPIKKILPKEKLFGPTSVPEPVDLMATYSAHLKYRVLRRRYDYACQSLYVRPQDMRQVSGSSPLTNQSHFFSSATSAEDLSEAAIEELINTVLNCREKYPLEMRRERAHVRQSHRQPSRNNPTCCIL